MMETNGVLFLTSAPVMNRFSQFNFRPYDSTLDSIPSENLIAVADTTYFSTHPEMKDFFSKYKTKLIVEPSESFSGGDSLLFELGFPKLICVDQLNDHQIQNLIDESLQKAQDQKLIDLATELNDQYESIKQNWTDRIYQHEQDLKDARLKLFNSNRRSEILKKILFEIAFETDLLRLESILNELVPKAVDVAWVKVTTREKYPQFLQEISELNVSYHHYECDHYVVVFIRSHAVAFRKQDLGYLQKIADGIEISVRRNETSVAGRELGRNLGMAFSSFPQPLAIIDQDYNVRYASSHFKKFSSSKCYQSLFGRTSPCEGCQLGQQFQLVDSQSDYMVLSQSLRRQFDDEHIFLNFYQDQIEQKRAERRLAEKSEIEDLGLVSSSIAHELNNPIGGVKSILQLNKMTLKADHPMIPEFESMLGSVEKIEKILRNLRDFAIRTDEGQKENTQLVPLIETVTAEQIETLKSNRIQLSLNLQSNLALNPPSNVQSSVLSDITILVHPEHMKRAIESSFHFLVQEFGRESNFKSQKIRMIEVKLYSEPKVGKIGIYLEILSNTSRPLTTESLRAIEFLNIQKILIDQGFAAELISPREDWFGVKMDLSTQT